MSSFTFLTVVPKRLSGVLPLSYNLLNDIYKFTLGQSFFSCYTNLTVSCIQ